MAAEHSAAWDLVADEWVDSGVDRLWRRHADRLNRRLIERWCPAASKRTLKTDLFDEIAGAGLATELKDRSEYLAGLDISQRIVSAARHRGVEGSVADVRDLPFATGSLDLVVSNSTLDHFESKDEIRRALAEIHRVLRVEGTLIVTLDNPTNPVVALRNSLPLDPLRRTGLVPYPVGATLGRAELEHGLRETGFAVRATEWILHCPRAWAVWRARRISGRSALAEDRFLSRLTRWERLRHLPTRPLTGHLVAACAIRL